MFPRNLEQINEIIVKHIRWRKGDKGGEQADFSDKDLSKLQSGTNYLPRLIDLSEIIFERADLRESVFQSLIFNRANLCSADLRQTDFSNSSMVEADLSNAQIGSTSFVNVDLSNAKFVQAICTNSIDLWGENTFPNFKGANLSGCDFTDADLGRANFENADLTNANLSTVKLSVGNFFGANLTGVKLDKHDFARDSVRANFSNFENAIMKDTSLKTNS